MPRIPRRRFLTVLAGGAGLVAAPVLTAPFRRPAADNPLSAAPQRVTRSGWALGSTVTMTALHADRSQATAALDDAFAELELVEEVMSIYRPGSQLSQLNRTGVYDNPHPYLVEVMQAATIMSQRTAGAFDVTIQPLWQTHWAAHAEGRQPTAAAIDAARQRIDWRRVDVNADRIRLQGAGTAVTLNGLAQGFAADRAKAALRRQGIEQALIDTGEFDALGQGSDGNGWNVGIQHPRHEDALIAVANLAGRCLATSGDYATRFDETFTRHHLLDPRTGRSASDLASVSIIASSGLAADALSTAAFVLGFDGGRDLVAATADAEALFVTKAGRTWSSTGFPLHEAT